MPIILRMDLKYLKQFLKSEYQYLNHLLMKMKEVTVKK